MKIKPIIVSVAAIAALGVSGTVAAGGGHAQFKTVRVTFQPTVLAFNPSLSACDTALQCVEAATVSATQDGDLVGSTVEADATAVVGTVRQTTVTGTFNGTVTDCGIGSLRYSGRRTDTDSGRSDATYVIVPGSGTGGLAGITGVMEQHGVGGPISGLFRCAVH